MPASPPLTTKSRAVRQIPTIAAFVLVALFLAAARWQYARMHEKQALRAQLDAAAASAPIALPHRIENWSKLRYQPVRLAGHYDAQRQILIDNRVERGRVGYQVVTPLLLDDGRAALVDRGFVPRGRTLQDLPRVPVPAGDVVVRGRIALPGRYIELGHTVPSRGVWQNLDPKRFSAATGLAVLPIVIEQDADDAPGDGLTRDWPMPDLGADRHLSYMLQWLTFAAIVIVLWIRFHLLRK